MKHQFFKTLIGGFGKGVKNSVTVNFSVSGGANCSDTCPLKNKFCYACNTEKVKPSITVNLEKKQENLSLYLDALNSEKSIIKLNSAPWVRFSAFGSIPSKGKIKKADRIKFKALADKLTNKLIHFPVETIGKYNFLKSCGFNPRLSLATKTHLLNKYLKTDTLLSVVIEGDKRAIGKNKRAHSKKAFDLAHKLQQKGINAKVCPAVSGSAKCGDCTMCADKSIPLIIYPLH